MQTWIPSAPGRKRFNVLGAINAWSKEILTVTNTTYINSQSVCDLLLAIAALGLTMPVTVVLDNARYQRCRLVQDKAAELGIELLFLPSYSPQLNLIERLWRFVRHQCLYSKYYQHFCDFQAAINLCLSTANTEHKNQLDRLLVWKFQSFKNVKLLAV